MLSLERVRGASHAVSRRSGRQRREVPLVKPELSLILVLAVASAVALLVRRLRVPYTLALVVAGLAIGATRIIRRPIRV